MAIVKCRECGADVSEDAKTCPHCGVETPDKKTFVAQIIGGIVFFLFIAWFIFSGNAAEFIGGIFSTVKDSGSKANCDLIAVEAVPDVFVKNQEPDAGYTVKVSLINVGKSDNIHLKAQLSSSEGTFIREQDSFVDAGVSRTFFYQFPEPTVNATNIESRAWCSPYKKPG